MTLVIVRHGESVMNAEGKFCGWVDVDLADGAYKDCKRASSLIKQYNRFNNFDICYSSVLKRSIKNAHRILEDIDNLYISVKPSWRLNERFYGELTGQIKTKMVEKYGKQQIKKWRRSYNNPPPSISNNNSFNPIYDNKYYQLHDFNINCDFPKTESLYHVIERIKPLYYTEILPLLKQNKNILLSIHGTSMRAVVALIEYENQNRNNKNRNFDFEKISKLEIPNGYPVVYHFDKNGIIYTDNNDNNNDWMVKQQQIFKIGNIKIHGRFLGDLDELLMAQNKVRNEIDNKTKTNYRYLLQLIISLIIFFFSFCVSMF